MSDRERRIRDMLYGDPGMTRQEAAEYYLGLEKGGLSSMSKEGAQRHMDRLDRRWDHPRESGDDDLLRQAAWVGLMEARDADKNRIRDMLYGDPGMTRAQAAEYYLGLEEGGLQSLSDKAIQRHMDRLTAIRTSHLSGDAKDLLRTPAYLGLNDVEEARQEAARQAASLRWLEEPKR